jgi:hypothetical protein
VCRAHTLVPVVGVVEGKAGDDDGNAEATGSVSAGDVGTTDVAGETARAV